MLSSAAGSNRHPPTLVVRGPAALRPGNTTAQYLQNPAIPKDPELIATWAPPTRGCQDPMLTGRGVAPLQTTYDSMVSQADQATAEVSVAGVERRDGRLVATVRVTNKAGHKFPSGHVNLDSTRAEGWKLLVVSSGKVDIGGGKLAAR